MRMLELTSNRLTVLCQWLAITLLLMAAAGCHKEEFEYLNGDTVGQPCALPDGAFEISPFDQTLDMAVWGCDSTATPAPVSSVRVTSPEADFLMPIGTQHLYVEQNDDRQWRTATVTVTRADGTQQEITLAQPPASRAASEDIHRSFLRHYAVGYSYEAVGGEYCNLNYVRCQLLNRMVVDEVEKETLLPLIVVEPINVTKASSHVYRSFVDYAQNTNFMASAKGEILFAFKGDANLKLHAFEDGSIETYILHDERVLPMARYSLQADNVANLVQEYPNMLTSSFRRVLKELAETSVGDWRAIDEFLETYGTHVVIDAELGARLDLDVQVETHKFHQEINEDVLAEVAIATMFNAHFSESKEESYWEVLRNCKCRMEVIGGDLNILDNIIGMTTFSNDDIHISPEDLSRWMNSVYYNDNDLENSNVEMTNMMVAPIWDLVGDKALKERIKARVYSNSNTMQKLLGNRNFINVKIPYSTTKYECRVGNKKYTFNNPDVTDIIASGRHVATICLETVPPIAGNTKVRVVYPIYEGHVKLANGLCVHNGHVYRVEWSKNKVAVEDLGEKYSESFDGNIYMNSGVLSTLAAPYTDYQDGHPVVGVERPGGIGIDGSLQGSPVRVVKHFNHFYLNKKDKYDNIPNWSYVTELPPEAANYPDYFDNTTWKNRMRRDDGYVYIYNTTEIGYE